MAQLARELIRFDGTVLWESNGGTPTRMLAGESGFGYPERQNLIDQIGDPYINLYRRTVSKERTYTVELDLAACSPTELDAQIAAWEELHAPGVERTLTRITKSGGIYYLDCVPEGPVWSERGLGRVHVSQAYVAANPWWYGPIQSATGNFNGATPVNIAIANGGNIPAWLHIAILGAVTTPRITVPGGYYIELDWDNLAGELLDINCQPPAIIEHTPAGSAATAVNIFGYRTSESWINKVQAPVGTTNVVLTATAGVAPCTIYWRNRYGAAV